MFNMSELFDCINIIMHTCYIPWMFIILLITLVIISIIQLSNRRCIDDNFTDIPDDIFTRMFPQEKNKSSQDVKFMQQTGDVSIQDAFTRCETVHGVGNCMITK